MERKEIRLANHDYSSARAYFVTICTLDREKIFWANHKAMVRVPEDVVLSEYGKIVDVAINNIPSIYSNVSIEKYAIMPDHLHLIIRIQEVKEGQATSISRVVSQLKGYVSKCIGRGVWQKLYYDHVIRNREDYNECASYIYSNPMKWSREYSEFCDSVKNEDELRKEDNG